MANSYIQKLAMQFPIADISVQGLIEYPVYCLPALRKRVTRILSLLGFDPVDGSDLNNGEWSEYIRLRKPRPEGSQRRKDRNLFTEDAAPPYLVAGPAWIKSGLGHTQVSGNEQRMESSEDASATQQLTRLNEQGIRHTSFLSGIVEAACLLSFTDWDQNLRLLSTSFLENPASWSKGLVFKKPLIDILTRDTSDRIPRLGMIALCETTIDVCIGRREVWTPVFSDEKMLAFHYCDIIFVQNAAFQQRLDLQSCFLHLSPGAIIADGEEKMELYTYSTRQQKIVSMTDRGSQMHKKFAPVDLFQGISFSTRLELSGEKIYLQQHALVKDQICAIPSPGTISRALAGLFVTKNCVHRYYDAITATKIDESVKLKRGLFLAGAEHGSPLPELWLQAVDQNAPGQWLAYHDFGNVGDRTVLQRGCCTACACKRLLDPRDYLARCNPGIYRIIHGRLPGEDME